MNRLYDSFGALRALADELYRTVHIIFGTVQPVQTTVALVAPQNDQRLIAGTSPLPVSVPQRDVLGQLT